MNNDKVCSPLTKSSNVKLLREIDTEVIINLYANMNINVKKIFKDINTIEFYECSETSFKFFYPYNVAGDNEFYQALSKEDWYYMPWKWEHNIAKEFCKDGMSILEIGCAKGDFIDHINSKFKVSTMGLEFNTEAAKIAQTKGLDVRTINLEELADPFKNTFDLVCSFQVLEHIANPIEFLNASIKLLKIDGRLIISVPNNDSYLKYIYPSLNMPPHHMGLWNKESLVKLTKLLPLNVEMIYFESLQKYHFGGFMNAQINRILPNPVIINKIINKLLSPFANLILPLFAKKIIGHSILIVFKKK